MVISLTENDIEFIKKEYSGLKIFDNKIEGILKFNRTYKNMPISDTYHLRLLLESRENSILPKVMEIGGKITKIAEKYNKKLEDIHINQDNTFCFMVDIEEKKYLESGIFNFNDFFINILEPYLYGMSFYEKKGFFPWGERAHGFLGLLESYNDGEISFEELIKRDYQKIILKNINIKGHHKCLCGSNKKIRECHKTILEAFYKLRSLNKIY